MYILHACTECRNSCRLVRVSLSSKPSQSPRRHPEIVPDSASKTHRSLRFSCVMRMPCCHVAPLYHVTLLPPVSRQRAQYEFCTQMLGTFAFAHRWYCSCVCASSNPIIVIVVENGGPSHGESPLLALHARTDSAVDGRFQDQTKRECVCMTKTAGDTRLGSTSCKKPNSPTGAVNKW